MADGQLWAVNSQGGYLANPKLSEKLRFAAYEQTRFRQFCNVKENKMLGASDTMNFDKILKLATGGGTLVETSTVPSDKYLVTKGTIQITEWGNKIPYTQKLELLSQFDVENPTQKRLRDDMTKTLDGGAATQFKAAEFKAVITATNAVTFTTNGTASATSTGKLHTANTKLIINYLKKKNVPFYDSKGYMCVGSVDGIGSLYDAFQAIMQYAKPEYSYEGEVGRFYNCRFVEETSVLSNDIGECIFFGDDAVMEGMALAEELRADVPTDLGRSKAIGWYALLGFKKVWSQAADGEEHIVHVTSA